MAAGAYYDGDGVELWTSDRTERGTVQVTDIYPGRHGTSDDRGYPDTAPNSSTPGNLSALNGTLFFTANVGTSDRELWKSDGTDAGTVMVKDIRTDTASYGEPLGSIPQSLTSAGGILLFTADDSIGGRELWKSDGTEAGTVMVRDINPGPVGSDPSDLTSVNGILYFAADNGRHGRELWRSDGSAKGTWRIGDIFSGRAGSGPSSLRAVSNALFFAADDGIHGSELWRSDGTLEGTSLVADINPGSNGSSPSKLTDVAGTLYFTADDRSHGTELWKTDGTAPGTLRMSDIVPGRDGSDPDNLTDVNGRLFFSADDHFHGRELWHIPFASLSNGTLTIDGTGQDDIITVKPSGAAGLRVSVNGVAQKFSATATRRIRINSRGGDDLIDFSRIATPTRVDAGPGDDSITPGAETDTLDGGEGVDTVQADELIDQLMGIETKLP